MSFGYQKNKGYTWISEDDFGEVMKANPDLSELRRWFSTKERTRKCQK